MTAGSNALINALISALKRSAWIAPRIDRGRLDAPGGAVRVQAQAPDKTQARFD